MKYNSLREYFYKLHTTLYAIILVPLLLFVFFYLEINSERMVPVYSKEQVIYSILTYLFCFLMIVDGVMAYFLFRRLIQATFGIVSLGEKLDVYFKAIVIRTALLSGAGILMATGFFLTANAIFTVFFLIILSLISILWPTPNRIAKELRLKNDERTIILKKGDLN